MRFTELALTLPYDPDFNAGLKTHRQVMGDDFVDHAFAGMTPVTEPMPHYITRIACGPVWQRAGLDLKTRSLITVAMITGLGKQHELKGHVRGALNSRGPTSRPPKAVPRMIVPTVLTSSQARNRHNEQGVVSQPRHVLCRSQKPDATRHRTLDVRLCM